MPTLPKGYSLADPSITIDGQSLYGGADISQAFDATGAHYVACDARGPDGVFKFRVFRKAKSATSYKEIPLPFTATGRGEIAVLDGQLWAVAWEGSSFQYGKVAGFAPLPSVVDLQQRIVDLERILADMSGALQALQQAQPPTVSGGVLTVPPQGGIEGGEIVLTGGDGGEDVHIDVYGSSLRIHRAGVVLAEWG